MKKKTQTKPALFANGPGKGKPQKTEVKNTIPFIIIFKSDILWCKYSKPCIALVC